MAQKSFEDLLLTGKLPSPAGVGMKILQLTRNDDFSAEAMGEAIRTDSALTGRILKLANSAALSGTQPVTTVNDAIMRLGSRSVRDLALAFSLVSERRKGACQAYDFDRYWTKSLARAVCSKALSRTARCGSPQEAYICGLLGEVGRLALASVYPEQYSELIARGLMEDSSELRKAEEEIFGIDHSSLAGFLIGEWGLPESLVQAVRDYSRKPEDAHGLSDLTSVLHHAEFLATLFVAGRNTPPEWWRSKSDGLEHLKRLVDLGEEEFEKFFDGCVHEWVSWGSEMQIQVQQEVRYKRTSELVHGGLVPPGESPVHTVRPSVRPVLTDIARGSSTDDRIHILAVDDEPLQRRLLSKYLAQDGYAVTVAENGREALRLALEKNPDIVIADYMMPEMDGLELCRLLRKTEAGSRMFFLLLTGRTEPEMLIEAFDAGCDDFVTKPFAPRLLTARIKGGVRVIRLQRKVDGDRVTMERQMAELGVLTRKLRTAALTDALTGLSNRRYAMKRLETEWSSSQRTGRPLTLIMGDIDQFKRVNDDHGHDVGDVVLVETAKVLQGNLREMDEVCRLGGEEFLVICRNTDGEEGGLVAERLRKAVEGHTVVGHGFDRNVTLSLGVACSRDHGEDVMALLKAADEAVYEAKRGGRNRTFFAPPPAEQKKSA
jgi:diguanylate cyclase (GGDEF)-like protein